MTPEELQREIEARGLSQSAAARLFRVHHSTVWRWLYRDMTIPDHRADSIRSRLSEYDNDI